MATGEYGTWQMASLRQRSYAPRSHRLHPRSVGPTFEPVPDRAGVRVNGTEVGLMRSLAYNMEFSSCKECGFTICGCKDRCEDCGSLFHAGCEDTWKCEHCGEYVHDDHAVDDCRQARASCRNDEIVRAYIDDVAPPAAAHPMQVISALNAWATGRQSAKFAGLDARAEQRCKSWLISMQMRTGDGLGLLQMLHAWNKQDDAVTPSFQARELTTTQEQLDWFAG